MIHFISGVFSYYTFWFFMIGGLSLFILFYSFIHLFKFFNILITPTTPIDKLKEGKIEVKGIVKREDIEIEKEVDDIDFNTKNKIEYSYEKLESNEVYHKKIEEEYVKGKNGGWKERSTTVHAIPFYLYDKNGSKVLIKPSGATFEFKDEIIEPLSSAHRIKHYSIKNDAPIYILGHCHNNGKELYISNNNNDMFFISTKKEISLLLHHGFKGFLFLFITIAIVSFSLTIANKKYKETWEGKVTSKTSYVSGSGKSRTTHYTVSLANETSSREITYDKWEQIKANDYIVKYENEFYVKIVNQE